MSPIRFRLSSGNANKWAQQSLSKTSLLLFAPKQQNAKQPFLPPKLLLNAPRMNGSEGWNDHVLATLKLRTLPKTVSHCRLRSAFLFASLPLKKAQSSIGAERGPGLTRPLLSPPPMDTPLPAITQLRTKVNPPPQWYATPSLATVHGDGSSEEPWPQRVHTFRTKRAHACVLMCQVVSNTTGSFVNRWVRSYISALPTQVQETLEPNDHTAQTSQHATDWSADLFPTGINVPTLCYSVVSCFLLFCVKKIALMFFLNFNSIAGNFDSLLSFSNIPPLEAVHAFFSCCLFVFVFFCLKKCRCYKFFDTTMGSIVLWKAVFHSCAQPSPHQPNDQPTQSHTQTISTEMQRLFSGSPKRGKTRFCCTQLNARKPCGIGFTLNFTTQKSEFVWKRHDKKFPAFHRYNSKLA